MTRFHVRPLSFALFTCVAIFAHPALAVVNTSGDVRPTATPFGVIFIDDDGDQFSDVISPAGNTVDSDLADPFDPNGGNGNGLAWDDPIIWRNYESKQNILIGEVGSGSLSINGGSALRYQHVMLGGLGDVIGSTGYELTATAAAEQFSLAEAINASNDVSTGFGVMTVTGFGSVFNNDPWAIDQQFFTALDQASYDYFSIEASPDPGSRVFDEGFDMYVGLSGGGELNVAAGGRVEVQDSLVVGLGQTASGTVNVSGSGSHLIVYGRDDFDPADGGSTATSDIGTVVGGNGQGSLHVTEGGRASFFGGLSLGDDNSGNASIASTGSGMVIVEGTGSTINAFASSAMVSPTTSGRLALAIGELRDTGSNVDPGEVYGDGRLQIGLGGTVNATFNTGYNRNELDANVEIGLNGTLEMRGGQLLANNILVADGSSLINDGSIDGYGFIRAYRMINTTYATIDGGDGTNGSLQIQIDSGETDPSASEFAFENLGEIKGNIDLTVQGGFGNGNTGGSNGGVIRATGKIHSGTFFNRPNAQLSVGPGESLSILATGNSAQLDPLLQEGSGGVGNPVVTGQSYFQANLGSISVDDGLLELGRLVATGGGGLPANNTDRFRNARVVSGLGTELALGTINSNDGELVFKTGLFNTGVVAFTGGDNLVRGEILNGAEITYGAGFIRPGIILISGDATSVTFEDNVVNEGLISIGPNNTVANFLGDLDFSTGTVQVAVDAASAETRSSAIIVGQNVSINPGGSTVIVNFISAAPVSPGFSIPLLLAGGELDESSLFSNLVLPDLPEGQFWDVIYDTVLDQIRLEIIESLAFGADFSGDGVVNSADLGIWISNVGILSGASAIQGDADLDGDVDQDDYLVLMDQIFTGVPVLLGGGGPIPEPSTALLALLASAALMSRRRS